MRLEERMFFIYLAGVLVLLAGLAYLIGHSDRVWFLLGAATISLLVAIGGKLMYYYRQKSQRKPG